MSLTIFDYFILGITGFFVVLGLLRGFIRELFSVINWFSSGLLVILLRPLVNNLVSRQISNSIISNVVSSIIIFIIVIIGFSILSSYIVKAINTKFPTSINVTLGLAFGFSKGFIISSLIFASILNIFGTTDESLSSKVGPPWLQNSQTYQPLSFGAYIIMPFTDAIMGKIKERYTIKEDKPTKDNVNDNNSEKSNNSPKINDLEKTGKGIEFLKRFTNKDESIDKTKQDVSDKIKKEEDGGYKKDQVDKLEHLINVL